VLRGGTRCAQRRLDADGRPHVESPERSHVGHDELEPVVQLEDGTLVDTRVNATYCGSCYGSEDKPGDCCNTCAEVRERYRLRGWAFASAGAVAQCKREGFLEQVAIQAGEGCQVYGHIEVNKVAGNFHFAPGKSFQQGAMHVHDLMAFGADAYFNMSHIVNKLSYGADFPGLVNPLDGAVAMQTGGHLMYQYFIKVVPTLYVDIKGTVLRTAQFSVTEHPKCVRACMRACACMQLRCASAHALALPRLPFRLQDGGRAVGAQPAGRVLLLRHQPHPGTHARIRTHRIATCVRLRALLTFLLSLAAHRRARATGAVRGDEDVLRALPDERVRHRGRRVHRVRPRRLLRVPRPPRAEKEDGAGQAHVRSVGGAWQGGWVGGHAPRGGACVNSFQVMAREGGWGRGAAAAVVQGRARGRARRRRAG
jgi:hypothetical protein